MDEEDIDFELDENIFKMHDMLDKIRKDLKKKFNESGSLEEKIDVMFDGIMLQNHVLKKQFEIMEINDIGVDNIRNFLLNADLQTFATADPEKREQMFDDFCEEFWKEEES